MNNTKVYFLKKYKKKKLLTLNYFIKKVKNKTHSIFKNKDLTDVVLNKKISAL